MQLLQKAKEQKPRAKRIDLTRYSSCVAINERETIVGELWITLPLGSAEPMLDISPGLAFVQRS